MKYHLKKFKVTSKSLWYWVYVYDDVEKLRIDAEKYKNEDHHGTWAVCQPVERVVIESGKPAVLYENVGVIRVLKDVGGAVSAHELLHGAMHIYRVLNEGLANFEDNCSDKEEELCYILTDLIRDFNTKMYKFGFWR